jgi:hypothetical protein
MPECPLLFKFYPAPLGLARVDDATVALFFILKRAGIIVLIVIKPQGEGQLIVELSYDVCGTP